MRTVTIIIEIPDECLEKEETIEETTEAISQGDLTIPECMDTEEITVRIGAVDS